MNPMLVLFGVGAGIAVVASAGATETVRKPPSKLQGPKAKDPIRPVMGSAKDPETARVKWNAIKQDYKKVPVVGELYVRFVDGLLESIGFAVDTSERDYRDMQAFDRWYAEIGEVNKGYFAKVQAFGFTLIRQYGEERVRAAAEATGAREVITAESIKTGRPVLLAEPWYTVPGWSEWYALVWKEQKPLPPVEKDWRKFQYALGDRTIRAGQILALGAADRFRAMIEVLES